ncbi:MAG: hypothetical protein ACR2P4_01470 [Gammaproteobacteria bacterium]
MKILPNKTFPHPVLSRADDYPKREFQPTLVFSLQDEIPVLDATFQLNEEEILSLVQKGKATYVVEILCPATYMRRVFRTCDNFMQCRFDERELYKQVEVNAFVACTAIAEEFSSPNFNEEFGATKFKLQAGDVLAAAPPQYYWWDTSFRAPLHSVVEIVADPSLSHGDMVIDTSGEKIQIRMSEGDKQRFTVMRQSKELKRYAMFVYFSAIAEVLRLMAAGGENENSKWYRAVEYKVAAMGKKIDESSDSFALAQELLKKPFGLILPKLED